MSPFHFNRFIFFRACCLLPVLILALSAGGCSQKSADSESAAVADPVKTDSVAPTEAGVATIDVTKIATECGKLAEINGQLNQQEAEFKLLLDGLRKIHLEKRVQLEKEYGDQPSEEQLRKLAALRNQHSSEYNLKWQETRIKLTAIKQKLDEQFLIQVKPIARMIAKKKGLSIVIRQENVFCLVDQYDITAEVGEEFKRRFPPAQKSSAAADVARTPPRGGDFVPLK